MKSCLNPLQDRPGGENSLILTTKLTQRKDAEDITAGICMSPMYLTVFLGGIGNSLITLFSKETCSRQTARVTKDAAFLGHLQTGTLWQLHFQSYFPRNSFFHWEGVESQHGLKAQLEGLAQWHPCDFSGAWWEQPGFDDHTHQHCHVLAVTLGNSPTRFDISFSFVVWGCHHHGVVARNAFDNPRIVPISGMTSMFQLVWTPMAWSTVFRILVTMYLESRRAHWIGVMTGIGADGLGESVLSFPFPFHTSRVLKRSLCYETQTQLRRLCPNGASLEGCWSIAENWRLVGIRRAVSELGDRNRELNCCQDIRCSGSPSPLSVSCLPSLLSSGNWFIIDPQ